jgi:hypothetical protein
LALWRDPEGAVAAKPAREEAELKHDVISDCVELLTSHSNKVIWRKDEHSGVDVLECGKQRLESRLPD